MPTLEETVSLACNLAPDYYAKNLSPYALMQLSGYLENGKAIETSMLRKHVEQHPELVKRWLVYSADKRVDSGWYFSAETAHGPYVVGHFPGRVDSSDQSFSDGLEACALFIKRELDEMRISR